MATEHIVYYKPGGLQNLTTTVTDLRLDDLSLTTNQVDCILRELTEAGFTGGADLSGNNAAPSEWGVEMATALPGTITIS